VLKSENWWRGLQNRATGAGSAVGTAHGSGESMQAGNRRESQASHRLDRQGRSSLPWEPPCPAGVTNRPQQSWQGRDPNFDPNLLLLSTARFRFRPLPPVVSTWIPPALATTNARTAMSPPPVATLAAGAGEALKHSVLVGGRPTPAVLKKQACSSPLLRLGDGRKAQPPAETAHQRPTSRPDGPPGFPPGTSMDPEPLQLLA